MGRGRLTLVGCLVATVALMGCGESSGSDPLNALAWNCGDFRNASSAKSQAAIETLAREVASATGNPVGEGKKVQAAIDRLCAGAPANKVVGESAVEAVVAGAEDPADKPAEITTTTTVPTETTTETTTPTETTTETTTHDTTTTTQPPSGHTTTTHSEP